MHSSPAGKKPHVSKKSPKPAPRQEAAGVSTGAKKKPATTKAPAKPKTAMAPPVVSLEPRRQRFVDEYLIDLNATQAAIRAGYSEKTAQEQSSRLLSNVMVSAAIGAARKQQQQRTQITADKVLREAWNIAIADVRELVQVKVGCCRHCHGEGFRRQRTIAEYNHDREAFAKTGGMPTAFKEEGGIGFDPLRCPNPGCPECGGDGHARAVIMDTRDLSDQARAIYAGAKATKFGVEVQLNSKDAALDKLFKHLGLYEKDNGQRADPLASLLHTIASGNSSGFRPVARDPEHDEKG